MSKQKGVKYNFSGNWDDVSDLLRKYSTSEVLKRINKESVDLFFNVNKSDMRGVKRVVIPLYHKGSIIPTKQEVLVMAWSLIDLAYYMIKTSNDYRGKSIDYGEELYALQVAIDNYKERKEKSFIDDNDGNIFLCTYGDLLENSLRLRSRHWYLIIFLESCTCSLNYIVRKSERT